MDRVTRQGGVRADGTEPGTHLPAMALRPSPGLKLHIVLDVVGYLGDGPGYVAPMGLYVDDLE